MRHAYLILAHNEFNVLQTLITCLDDARNDIFIHFDKKIKQLPQLVCRKSRLDILSERVDVRWADVSMIEAEYLLFEKAYNTDTYDYFHLLSGVDLPIQTVDKIDSFFEENRGKEFIGFYQENMEKEMVRRVQRYHLFPKTFRETNGWVNFAKRFVRYSFLQLQSVVGYRRNKNITFKKGTQWVSVTREFANYLLSQKEWAFRTFRNTFCCDEILAQTICWNSPFKERIYDATNEGRGCMRCIGWKNGELITFTDSDYNRIIASQALFARKFSEKSPNLIQQISHIHE